MDIYKYDQTDSTNSRAKEKILSGAALPCLFIANSQTCGRGRMGKSFYSPENTGLYMSLALPKEYSLDAVSITSLSAVAVARAIKQVCNIETKIKWVNDLYIENKKVCGILTEAVTEPTTNKLLSVIVGVGINLSTTDFPEEIKDSASSLFVDSKVKDVLAEKIAENLIDIKNNPTEIMEEYRQRSMVLSKEITYLKNNRSFVGVAKSIDDKGYLYIEKPDKSIEILSSGEISIKLK